MGNNKAMATQRHTVLEVARTCVFVMMGSIAGRGRPTAGPGVSSLLITGCHVTVFCCASRVDVPSLFSPVWESKTHEGQVSVTAAEKG